VKSVRVWPLTLVTCGLVIFGVYSTTDKIVCLPINAECYTQHDWSAGLVFGGVLLGLLAGIALTGVVYVVRRGRGSWFTPAPGRLFHVLFAAAALLLLWSWSYPGFDLLTLLLAGAGLLALGAWWLLALVVQAFRRRPQREWFLFAPVVVVLIIGLMTANGPLLVRWQFSKAAFNREVGSVLAYKPLAAGGGDWEYVGAPGRIGSYCISDVRRVPGGLLFDECHGALFDNAGFGWFPDGPDAKALDNGSFEAPDFTHLGGPWYAWTASW